MIEQVLLRGSEQPGRQKCATPGDRDPPRHFERKFGNHGRRRTLPVRLVTEYGRAKQVVADKFTADEIRAIGIRKAMELTKMSRHTIEKLVRGEMVKRKTHERVLKAIHAYRSTMTP